MMDGFYNSFIPDRNMMLKREFYLNDPLFVARNLIGKVLVKNNLNGLVTSMIVETEAYLSEGDLSSHSAKGISNRNKAMFETGGCLYVYKIFGLHHCVNIVTEPKGIGSAVLLRAAEPISGLEIMMKNRGTDEIKKLCRGPGSLAQAYNFNLTDNFKNLFSHQLYIQNFQNIMIDSIKITNRIGITKSADLLYRFFLMDSKYVSARKS